MRSILSVLMVLLVCGQALAKTRDGRPQQPEAKPANKQLARKYVGVFRWDTDSVLQKVVMEFTSIEPESGGVVMATGRGMYEERTEITVKARLHTQTGDIEIWESNPTVGGEATEVFVSNGSHVGTLSEGGQIRAVWTTNGTREHGTLQLTAVP